jgi:hypothetical protein
VSNSNLMIQSFLELDGVEISNGARTIQYLRNGEGSDRWQVGDGCACSVLYREWCPTAGSAEACFVSPAADPAPWYDATIPESGEFLGVLIKDVREWFKGEAQRNVTPRISGLGGASIGPMHQLPRELVTPATLIANSCAGMEYGRRWLQAQLAALCDPCALGTARIRSFCPDDEGADDEAGEWFVYEVGLVTGVDPQLGQDAFGMASFQGGDDGCCDFLETSFTLLAGNPFLYKRDQVCIEASLNPEACSVDCIDFCRWLNEPPPPVQCTIDPPSLGILGAVITVTAGAGVHNLTLSTLTDCDDPASVTGALGIPYLPAGSTFIFDSALHQLTYIAAGGDPVDGTPYISLPFGYGVPWLEIGDCNPAGCIQAQLSRICDSDCTTRVEIATRLREA